jgi:hypothetical protein
MSSIRKAGEILSCDNDKGIIRMIKAISQHENENDLIDYVDGVVVWEKLELEFTCKEFLYAIE